MPGQARIEDRVTVGLGRAIFQCGRIGRLEEVRPVEKGFGTLGEERRSGVGIREERRKEIRVGGIGEGGHLEGG